MGIPKIYQQDRYGDPFDDVASRSMPDSLNSVLELCEYVYDRDGTYGRAIERVVSYFLTDISLAGISDDEQKKWHEFYNEFVKLLSCVKNVLENRQCYGNAFVSVIVKFQRFLVCKQCGKFSAKLSSIYRDGRFEFDFRDYEFIARCPLCRHRGPMIVDDKEGTLKEDIIPKVWNPKEIRLVHDLYTGENEFFWSIPSRYKQDINSGKLMFLERVPASVLRTIKYGQDYRFNPGNILHLKDPVLAGRYNAGWGFPRVFKNYRSLFYVQMLRRYNEALMLDYVIPTRVLTPLIKQGASGAGASFGGSNADPLASISGSDVRASLMKLVRDKNRRPDDWHTVPFPVQYQLLGGDANKLAPSEMLDSGVEQLLNEVGVAVDFYRGDLQTQAAPTTLRLMESTWRHLVTDANDVIRLVTEVSAQTLRWTKPKAELKSITLADDLDKHNMTMQLMLNNKVSTRTALNALGLNAANERKQILEEAIEEAKEQAEAQSQMEADGIAMQLGKEEQGAGGGQGGGQGGGPPAGGAPAGDPAAGGGMPLPVSEFIASAGPNPNIPLEDLQAAAQAIAQDLLSGQVPESVKDSELRKLKQYHAALHSLVGTAMDEIRSQAKTQGGAMLLQQGPAG